MTRSPDDRMLAPGRAIVGFLETRDRSLLDGVFADDSVILESVAPYLFDGPDAVTRWADVMVQHVGDHDGLLASIGEPQEFSTDGDRAFYSLPVTWRFAIAGGVVSELGAMALLVRRAGNRWVVERYAWAVALNSRVES